jgi:hypothetical protein
VDTARTPGPVGRVGRGQHHLGHPHGHLTGRQRWLLWMAGIGWVLANQLAHLPSEMAAPQALQAWSWR